MLEDDLLGRDLDNALPVHFVTHTGNERVAGIVGNNDLWLGRAKARPYHPEYVPLNWRGW